MTDMDNDLKDKWQQTKFRRPEPWQRAEIEEGRRRTALQKLADRYRHFSTIALVMTFAIPFLVSSNVLKDATPLWRLAWMAFAMCYFGLCSALDYWLYRGISGIDCATMSVSEVSLRAMRYRKRHLQSIIVLLPMAAVLIGGMAALADANVYFLYGLTAGGIAGLAIGVRQFLSFMADYRSLRD